ncbi:MAG: hypothetical protein FWH51_01160, partial [Dehalococcoidia bacterium]|nr:hypothetical protein [Dehalococcoidia bacterium]
MLRNSMASGLSVIGKYLTNLVLVLSLLLSSSSGLTSALIRAEGEANSSQNQEILPELSEADPNGEPNNNSEDAERGLGNSISGFLWVDGNGSLSTDWDGLYNGSELPLSGYPVYLYAADDLSTALGETYSGADGTYLFGNIEPGEYALGLKSATVAGYEYLLPMALTSDNKFAIDWASDPLMAYTDILTLADDEAVSGINAGMRLPMGIVRAADTSLAAIWAANLNSLVSLDGYTWIVVEKKTVGGLNCVLLLRAGSTSLGVSFGSSNTYEGSNLQSWMTTTYNSLKTIKSVAVVPSLGLFSSPSAISEPTAIPASSVPSGKDILFALSYQDVYRWNGNKISPLTTPLNNYFSNTARHWLRTSAGGSVHGWLSYSSNPASSTIDAGLNPNATGAYAVPAVWISTTALPQVTVHYVDDSDTMIKTPSAAYPLAPGSPFALSPAEIPDIPLYDYSGWKIGLGGTVQSSSTPVSIASVDADTDIYLIYQSVPYTGTIDLSETTTGGTGYTITGVTAGDEYSSGAYSGGVVPAPSGKLIFDNGADGLAYRIIQSGNLANPTDGLKNGTSIFNDIIILDGVSVTLIIDDIDLSGNIDVRGTADLTLLLANSGDYGIVDASYIRGSIFVINDGLTEAYLAIDSAIVSGSSDGSLTVTATVLQNAAVGGASGQSAGLITILGGTVTATTDHGNAGGGAAAIGGASGGSGGVINISGGTVIANSTNGAAIGGGNGTANGGIVTINGDAHVNAHAGLGAGIGTGAGGDGATIVVSGNAVVITVSDEGAGIGGYLTTGSITINGDAEVTAIGGTGAGIGGGFAVGTGGSGGDITIGGNATVEASGLYGGAGIGGGVGIDIDIGMSNTGGSGGTIIIEDGAKVTSAGVVGAGIGGG